MNQPARLRRRLLTLTLLLAALVGVAATEPRTQASGTCEDGCHQAYQDCLYYLGSGYQTMCAQRRDYCLMHCN